MAKFDAVKYPNKGLTRVAPVILDGPSNAANAAGPFVAWFRVPQIKTDPSRRLDRDGERAITKVVAGTCNHLKLLFQAVA
jgi:hypothetical protein